MNFKKLDQLKIKLDSYRPLEHAMLMNLREDLILRWTYHSNAIEGNTLTLNETKVALEGITIGGKSLREHFEAINHKEAIKFVESLVQADDSLSEYTIKSLHALIMKNIDETHAGSYRNINVLISGATHLPPSHIEVASKMESFIHWYRNDAQMLHPIERACRVHVDFVGIHPFRDGNGRTSRLLMNFELMKNGFPPVVLKVENRLAYYEALDKAHTLGEYDDFIALVTKLVEESFEPYWFVLGV
jgi:Fic family protein